MLNDVKTVTPHDADLTTPDRFLEGERVGRTHHEAIRDELNLIRRADELGYDTCWLREHHFTDYGFLPNTMILAAHAAVLTERIRLGTAVVTLPLHHPVRAAEDIALVDVLSGGRVDVGIGRGYQSVEFNTFGVPLAEARERTDEAIEVMRALWTTDEVDHRGRHWDFERVHLQPRPIQQPHPPLYYASVSTDSITHYAQQGIPFIVDSTVRTSQLAVLADTWRSVARAHGHNADDAELVAMRSIWLDRSDDAARDHIAKAEKVTSTATDPRIRPVDKDGNVVAGYEYWEKGWHGRDLEYYSHEPDWDDRWVAGGPERVLGQLRDLEAIGIKNVICGFGVQSKSGSGEESEERMAQFAKEIIPELR
jgi:alkanesulfonate monooxygenase SsuD/methylene tetrahydromethanopterin reductase-like flavin-dependent oxidoreductase (luciferase family)